MEFYPEGCRKSLAKTFESVEEIKNAMMKNEIIEGKVLLCDREHNLHIDLGAIRGIIQREEGALGIDDGTVRDIALISKVGKNVCFNIMGFQRDVLATRAPYFQEKTCKKGARKNFWIIWRSAISLTQKSLILKNSALLLISAQE